MSFTARSVPPEADDDDAGRVALAREAAIRATVEALNRVTYVPGSPHKRFARQILDQLNHAATPITDRQEQHILRCAWRYRRQMPAHLVPKTNPDDPLSPERAMPWPGRQPTKKELLDG